MFERQFSTWAWVQLQYGLSTGDSNWRHQWGRGILLACSNLDLFNKEKNFFKKNEIVIGTANGEIFVYKGSLVHPWLKFSKQIGCVCFTVYLMSAKYKIFHIFHLRVDYLHGLWQHNANKEEVLDRPWRDRIRLFIKY